MRQRPWSTLPMYTSLLPAAAAFVTRFSISASYCGQNKTSEARDTSKGRHSCMHACRHGQACIWL